MEVLKKLYDKVHPSHVVVTSVYFNEMDNQFYARVSTNKKPTGDNLPIITCGKSTQSAMIALELAVIEMIEFVEKGGDST
jgi:hypothetical protein